RCSEKESTQTFTGGRARLPPGAVAPSSAIADGAATKPDGEPPAGASGTPATRIARRRRHQREVRWVAKAGIDRRVSIPPPRLTAHARGRTRSAVLTRI